MPMCRSLALWMVSGEGLDGALQGRKEMQTKDWWGEGWPQWFPGSQTPLVQCYWPLGLGSPLVPALFSNLATPSCVSPLDDHKPIWMHAEEREEMSKVS